MTGLRTGTRIADRYVLETLVARGGMGAVYRAIDEKLGRTVAIKFLLAELAEDEVCLARFEREASATARLSHPAIVQVLDFGKHEGAPYLVMEHLVGRTIADELDGKGKVEPLRAADWIEQALAGLSAAHQEGIVHRDIKPGNLMILSTGAGASAREVVKVLDFGLAQLKESAPYQRLTKLGSVLGTPMFMAPEQARGEGCDPRTDVYATGIVLWCCVTGQRPFPGQGAETLKAVLTHTPPRADAIDPSIPAELASVIERAMHKDRTKRFPTALAFAGALAEVRARVSSSRLTPATATPPPAGATPIASIPAPATPPSPSASLAPAAPASSARVWIALGLVLALLGVVLVAGGVGAYAFGLFDRFLPAAPAVPIASGAPPSPPPPPPVTGAQAPPPIARTGEQGTAMDACARLVTCCEAFRAHVDPDTPCGDLAARAGGQASECDAQRNALARTADLPECR
ncbi:MAG: serine/threonine-protein kinase [Sandaracinus sp.]